MKKTPGDVIVLHMCTVNEVQMMCGSWDMEWDRQNFFVILSLFLLFYSTNNPKNKNFKEMKKMPGDIIILHRCTINDNHKMYGSWDMKRDRQNFLSFWAIFCPFTPLTTWKIKILKKRKNNCRYHHFTQMHQKSWSYATYCSWDVERDGYSLRFSFWTIFCLLTPVTAWKTKFKKK